MCRWWGRPLHRSRRDGAGDQVRPDRPHRRRAASIADPFLPRKIDEGRTEDICGCIGCNICISRFNLGSTIICTQNPTVMEEYRRGWHPERFDKPERSEAALVVGAGPAGLECARVLGMRGYRVSLVEAETTLGGHLRDVIRLPGLAEWGRVITYREGQLARMANVEILRGAGMVTAADVLDFGAARIVLATGARWVGDGLGPWADPVPGAAAEHGYCVTPEQFFAGKPIGQRVVVLDSDGYFMASSIAERLADQGKQVTIVTQLEKVAPMTDLTLEGFNMKRMMREKGIHERIGHWVELLRPAGNQVEVVAYDLYRDGSARTTQPTNGIYAGWVMRWRSRNATRGSSAPPNRAPSLYPAL